MVILYTFLLDLQMNLTILYSSDFTNSQLPNFATFNVTVVVANQSSVVTSTNKFRTGVANSDPIVFPYNGTMNEDTILVILLNGNDPDPGDSVTFFVSSTPTHGNLYQFSSSALNSRGPIIDTSLSPVAVQDPFARLVYIPFIEFSGMDDFTFLGRDGSNAESTVVSGNITVNPVADQPVPRPLLIEINEDNATVINFDVQDPDTLDGNLTVILLSIPPPEKGELYEVDDLLNRESKITSAPYNVSNYRKRVLYVPLSNAYGNFFTSVIYRAADESQMSLVNATVTISINSVNDVPTAENKSYVMLEDSDLTITFECQDADVEDRFAILIESVPPTEEGSLFQTDVRFQAPIYADDRLSRTVVQFKPRENYFGNTSISFRCVDNVSTSEIAFIDIEVRNVNDLPTAPSFSVVSDEDTDVIIPFPLSDIESPVENLTIIVMNLPRRGILHYPVMENGSIIWIPMNETGFVVPDFNHTLMFRPPPDGNGDPFAVFPYLVDDGSDKSSINGTVTIIINAVNDPPSLDISSLSNLSVNEDGELTITMDVRDVDNDNRLWVRITDIRINGSLFHVNRRTGANTRLVVGEGSEIVGPPYQVIFVPSKDFASNTSETYQRFNVTFSDTGTDNETNSHEIVFPVIPVNDAPRIDCSSPFIILPQDKLNISNTVVNITLFASDVDKTNLDFVISSLPNRGMLVDPSTGSQILLNTPFRNPNIVFNSSGSGAGYPYGNFTVYVKDPSGSRSAQCTFQLTFTCTARTYANMFLLTLQTYNMILNIIYIVLVSQSLKIFDCTQEADGQYYLGFEIDAQPSDWWYEHAPMGAIGLVFYVIGIPLYFTMMLGVLYQTKFYGSLCIRAKEWTFSILDIESSFFKPTRQHFLVIQLIRKLFIVLIKMFLTRYEQVFSKLLGANSNTLLQIRRDAGCTYNMYSVR
ncbi:hypothetical protein BKA69DRAFT_229848 [Paraphysoderma sedebokerense]|nr:hypothetical protein BKA69DRAFT_229848 [Paraphysoderma sedebokerense]